MRMSVRKAVAPRRPMADETTNATSVTATGSHQRRRMIVQDSRNSRVRRIYSSNVIPSLRGDLSRAHVSLSEARDLGRADVILSEARDLGRADVTRACEGSRPG